MIEMTVSGVAVDGKRNGPLVVLSDANHIRALPVWVGVPEANAISLAMQGTVSERPRTHQLLMASITALGHRVHRVVINRVENGTYFAEIEVCPKTQTGKARTRKHITTLDARPSDAIVIALLAKAPIFVEPEVLASTSVPFDPNKDEEERDAFNKFVADVKASDFKLPR